VAVAEAVAVAVAVAVADVVAEVGAQCSLVGQAGGQSLVFADLDGDGLIHPSRLHGHFRHGRVHSRPHGNHLRKAQHVAIIRVKF